MHSGCSQLHSFVQKWLLRGPALPHRPSSPQLSSLSYYSGRRVWCLPFSSGHKSPSIATWFDLLKMTETAPLWGAKIYLHRLRQKVRNALSLHGQGSLDLRTCLQTWIPGSEDSPSCFNLTCLAAADANAFCFRYRGAATFHSFSCKAYRRKPQKEIINKYPV